MTTNKIIIRDGIKEDIPSVFELIKELAAFENATHEIENSVAQLITDGFGENPLYGLLVAESGNQLLGISLYYFRYSTWKGKRLYLEDLFISENARGQGIGSKLFEATMKIAINLNCNGMTWAVLNWNEPALKFYEKYKAVFDKEWTLTNLAKGQIEQNLRHF